MGRIVQEPLVRHHERAVALVVKTSASWRAAFSAASSSVSDVSTGRT
jgi:hypothetical protein